MFFRFQRMPALVGLFAMLSMVSTSWGQQAGQQPGQQTNTPPPKVTATIQEIKPKGRSHVLVVANDAGKTMEILLGKTQLDIKGTGDAGFVRPGTYIGGEATLSNNMLFMSEVSVFLPAKGQKVPKGQVRKLPPRVGQSGDKYTVLGAITATQQNPDYPDLTMVAINAAGRFPPINLEKGFTVKVSSANPEYLSEGMKVELDGQANRGRFNVTKVTARVSEPFKSEEVLGKPAEE